MQTSKAFQLYSYTHAMLLTLPILFLCITYTHAESIGIDFADLSQAAVAGRFQSLGIVASNAQVPISGLKQNTSSLSLKQSDSVFILASGISGSITTLCTGVAGNGDELVYVGGNISSISGVAVNNIAVYNTKTQRFSDLNGGVDGVVTSVQCAGNNADVYVTGSFTSPIEWQNSETQLQFLSKAYKWNGEKWLALPRDDFSGDLAQMQLNQKASILAAFTKSTTKDKPVGSFLVPLYGASIQASTSSSNLTGILCPKSTSASWTAQAGANFRITFPNTIRPNLVRIRNLDSASDGTRTFRILSNRTPLLLSYYSQKEGTRNCSNACPLLVGSSNQYYAFRILQDVNVADLTLEVISISGTNGGISGFQVYAPDVSFSAVKPSESCETMPVADYDIITTGSWVPYRINANYEGRQLTITPAFSGLYTYNLASVVTEPGEYVISVFTPGCLQTNDCNRRGIAEVNVEMGQTKSKLRVDQSSRNSRFTQVFRGTIDFSSVESPTLFVSLQPAGGINGMVGRIIIADSIRITRLSSSSGVALYDFGNSASSWSNVPANTLPPSDRINTVYPFSKETVAIGGSFQGGFTIVNIETKKSLNPSLSGLNGQVLSIDGVDDKRIVVGGEFTTANGNDVAPRLAFFDVTSNAWSAVGGGVDGRVRLVKVKGNAIHIVGDFSRAFQTKSDKIGVVAPGYIVWDLSTKEFKTNGQLSTSSLVPTTQPNDLSLYIFSPSELPLTAVSPGLAIQTDATSLQPVLADLVDTRNTSFTPDVHAITIIPRNQPTESPIVVVAGTLFKSSHYAIALLQNDTVNTLPSRFQNGEVFQMVRTGNRIWIGGSMRNGSDGETEVVVVDVTSVKNANVGGYKVTSKSGGRVEVSAMVTDKSSVIIGGTFDEVDGTVCLNVCKWDGSKWGGIVEKSGPVQSLSVVDATLWVGTKEQTPRVSGFKLDGGSVDKEFAPTRFSGSQVVKILGAGSNILVVSKGPGNQIAVTQKEGDQETSVPIQSLTGEVSDALLIKMNKDFVANQLVSGKETLMLTGAMNLNNFGSVSAVYLNGSDWVPYLVASDRNNLDGRVSRVAFELKDGEESSGLEWWHIVLIVLGSLLVLGSCIACICCCRKRRMRARDAEDNLSFTSAKQVTSPLRLDHHESVPPPPLPIAGRPDSVMSRPATFFSEPTLPQVENERVSTLNYSGASSSSNNTSTMSTIDETATTAENQPNAATAGTRSSLLGTGFASIVTTMSQIRQSYFGTMSSRDAQSLASPTTTQTSTYGLLPFISSNDHTLKQQNYIVSSILTDGDSPSSWRSIAESPPTPTVPSNNRDSYAPVMKPLESPVSLMSNLSSIPSGGAIKSPLYSPVMARRFSQVRDSFEYGTMRTAEVEVSVPTSMEILELGVKKGEMVKVIDRSDPDYYLAESSSGVRGLIPRVALEKVQ